MQKILATKEAVKVKTYKGSPARQFSGSKQRHPGKVFYSMLQLVSDSGKKPVYTLLLTQITFQIDDILRRNKVTDFKQLSEDAFEKFLIKEIKRSSPMSHPKKAVGTFTDIELAKQAFIAKGKKLK